MCEEHARTMMSELTNGNIPQPTPTPVPVASQGLTNGNINGFDSAADKAPAAKIVRWTEADKEIQKTSAAIGLSTGAPITNGYNTTSKQMDLSGMKFISLASPLNSSMIQKSATVLCPDGKEDSNTKSIVLQSRLPIRATLHKQKQIPGRFFPSPSYTEFQRDVLESRPTPRRVIKKFKPKNGADNSQLFPTGSPVKPRTANDRSTWVANHVYSRGSQGVGNTDRGLILAPDIDASLNSARQYSIPATTSFHDGNNDTFITGSSKMLHSKDSVSSNDVQQNRTVQMPR